MKQKIQPSNTWHRISHTIAALALAISTWAQCPTPTELLRSKENENVFVAAHVDEYIQELHPVAFQFRMASTETETYHLLPHVLQAGSRAFVAATWPLHTAGHDDNTSIFSRPSEGWGWLVDERFTIIETNFPKDLLQWLRTERRHR